MVKMEVKVCGVDDVWLVEDGFVIEGMLNNVYIVKDGMIIICQLFIDILYGIICVLLLCYVVEVQMQIVECFFIIEEVQVVDEVFFILVLVFVLLVVEIDGVMLVDGKVGLVVICLCELYIQELMKLVL